MKKIITIILGTFTILFIPYIVKAGTYNTNYDLFENSYTNNLIDMAESQIANFNTKKYAIIRINDDYYLFASLNKDTSVSGNTIKMNDVEIVKAIRTTSSYNTYYNYSKTTETNTTINVNNIITSNINISKAVSSSKYNEYEHYKNINIISIFILGLVFAIFITKERNY